jgi:C4-dicarboxylate transporter, DctM subunit
MGAGSLQAFLQDLSGTGRRGPGRWRSGFAGLDAKSPQGVQDHGDVDDFLKQRALYRFGWILTTQQVPRMIAEWILGVTDDPIIVLLLINLLLLFVGMFMETIAALIILVPPLLAVATSVGIDPLHFAVIAVLNLMIGLTTPPVGVCLLICANMAKVSPLQVTRAIWPFLLANIGILLLVSYIPALSLWLPSLFAR